MVKNSPVNVGDLRDTGLILSWEDPLEKEMTTIPVFWPGKSHGQRSLDRGASLAWARATVHEVTKSQTRVK